MNDFYEEDKSNFLTAAHPSPPNYTSAKEARPCGVDVQMGLKG
jgi:hypothetical protein